MLSALGGVVLLALVISVGVFDVHRLATPRTSASASTIATSTIAEDSDTYTIHIEYPKFAVEKADREVQAIVDKAVTEFKALPPNPTPVAAKNEMDGEYQVINTGPEILSAKMEIYQFTGGAHGMTVTYGLNFHRDGTPVTEEEALGLTGKSLEDVSAEAMKQLNERFGLVQFPEGAAPSAENYSTFVIGTSSVNFIFQQYQVEAYAAGMPEITLPRVR